MSISARIRETRIRRGLTQHDLASAVGVRSTTVWRWENGRTPGWDYLPIISAELGVSNDWLLTGKHYPGEAA